VLLLALVVACAARPAASGPKTWRVEIDPDAAGVPVSRALLGHYDLSGALFAYDEVPGLVAAATEAGIAGADWRVGLSRWEAATRLLPSLTSGAPCPIPTPAAGAAPGATDLELIASRDWFTDDGAPVTLADTADASRYALGYARDVLDVAAAFGARPFVSVDGMPRALSASRTPLRDDCLWTFRNRVSNVRPADPEVFAAALIGALERLRLGSGGEPGRVFEHVELWNEPELPFFWDRSFEDGAGELDRFFEMAVTALVALDAWRAASPHAEIRALRFGLGSFASAETASLVVAAFDATPLPGGARIPLDFLSFHAYADDPRAVVQAIERVRAARDASTHYAGLELVLAEWGPDLDAHASDPAYAASVAPALHAATVLARGAGAGLARAHRSILWDFYPDELVTLGMVDHVGRPKPLHRAYALLARLIGEGGALLPTAGSGRAASGSVLATRDASGKLRMLFVNPDRRKHKAKVMIDGQKARPSAVFVFSDPDAGITSVKPKKKIKLPARSLVVAEF
jgi:hypothetical protein